ncbi:protein CDV3 homolog [Tribolium madens]|uniref:protein CDV3 homolog n=1 Tax=Tribolium madens TaxID=41895 RepID=UPI001CF74067|nr:protein CDV3 homolog [Tribolium madens]
MADLDDFFAKKDRKKQKSTKKFATTDEVAKKLEDNAKKSEKQKKERVPEGDESSTPAHDQDEWKDFEEEKKDYSGLKIGNLTITSPTDGSTGATETSTEQQQGFDEAGQESEKKVGPWKRVDVEVQEEPVKVPEKKPEPPPVTKGIGGAYVPPSMRNQPQQSHQSQPTRLRSKAAPDIHNEEFFPTLSKTSDHKKNRSEGAFEVVQHTRAGSHRQVEQAKASSGQGPKLSLENRYNTLSDS